MLTILHIINSLGFGGAERRVIDASIALSQKGHKIVIVTLTSDHSLARPLFSAGVEVISLNIKHPRQLLVAIIKYLCIVRRVKPHIIHSHLTHASIVARVAAVINRDTYKLVTTQHNAYWPKENNIWYRIERATRSKTSHFIALSQAIHDYLKKQGCSQPISVIPTGIEKTAFSRHHTRDFAKASLHIEPSEIVVGTIATLRQQKGILYGVKAINILKEHFSNIRYVIVGDGPSKCELMEYVISSNLRSTINFYPYHEDIRLFLEAFDFFLLPSLYEGFGRVLLEAMAMEIPVIGTSVEGIPEVFAGGKAGVIVPPNNPQAIAEAIRYLINNQATAKKYTEAGIIQLRQRFDLSSMVEEELSLYLKLTRDNEDSLHHH